MPETPGDSPKGGAYPRYVLVVLVLVYVFNFLDRQIVSILAERIKADLGVTDAQLGFLYGTVFAVFFAVFGIPLGRLADAWDRRRLIAWGAAFWSLMTALSGFAKNFPQLALARMGVGVGEASAAPAAYSLLSDWFPKEKRATVLGLYSSGIYIGAGLGLGIGGLVVDRWDLAFPSGTGPFGLRGWQAAFLAVGLPGLVLAAWVRSLREPARAASHPPLTTTPVRTFLRESASVLPPFTLFALAAAGAGAAGVLGNVAAFAALGGLAWLLTLALGNPAQWIALAAGLYAVFSWAQALRLRSREDFDLVFRNRALVLANLGFGLVAFGTYGTSFWIAPYFVRVHHLNLAKTGLLLGGISAAGGWLGATCGRTPRGRVGQEARGRPPPRRRGLGPPSDPARARDARGPLARARRPRSRCRSRSSRRSGSRPRRRRRRSSSRPGCAARRARCFSCTRRSSASPSGPTRSGASASTPGA